MRFTSLVRIAFAPSVVISSLALAAQASPAAGRAESTPTRSMPPESTVTHYRTTSVDGVELFYREAGPSGAPVIVLLHGFPTSSHMFRNLIPRLAVSYHVIAPDYPAFGQSSVPDRRTFQYGFARYAELMDGLLSRLGAKRYALYVQDYGAPVGYRLALKHPERVSALVVQNGNAYEQGLSDFWKPIKRYWADGSQTSRDALRAGLTPAATKSQYVDGVLDASTIDPDNWAHDQALLDRPGIDEIMLDLFKDYASNVALYPQFQSFFRTQQPPTLLVWGKNDAIFPAPGALAYLRDLPNAELHLLNTGHFALEDKPAEIAGLMLDFLDRNLQTH